jgi:hypothetical protein
MFFDLCKFLRKFLVFGVVGRLGLFVFCQSDDVTTVVRGVAYNVLAAWRLWRIFSTKLQSKNRSSNIAQIFQPKNFARSLAKPMLNTGLQKAPVV